MKHMSVVEKTRIVQLSKSGKYNLKEIADQVNRSEATVSYVLTDYLKRRRGLDKESLWLNRLRKYIEGNKDHGPKSQVCTWWLRLEYDNKTSTTQINYWLNKSVAKGILGKKATRSYTKYWFLEKDVNK